ncbi:ABC transporter substrate-binding protein [Marinococcus sp. PL1-022]|uniref:ABC transporter substrate-binding protein n=1 Tax=Marinococcus sp. PL1-022 TaxID=3095363 RepID=UPI0029C278CE|nr:ABC transporter substrate-binding protein [Marinococcus sp. PL1-022]MDX6152296.1 ABC transporter substrate-binding protein [Marinococcus sp. PL1-022]
MKKLYLAPILSLPIILTACGGGGGSEEGSGSDENNEILMWHYYTGSEEVFKQMAKDFNESQDEYTLETEYVPFDEMKKQLSVGSAGDTLPDLIISDTVDNASLASMGVLNDISSEVEEWGEIDDYLKAPVASTKYEDGTYGVPLTTNSIGLFYNEKMLEENGIEKPPETWEELNEAAEATTNSDHDGFAMSAVRSEESTFQFYPFLLSAGADENSLDSPEAAEALNFVDDMLAEGYMSEEVLNSTQDDLARKFANESVAMMINGPWVVDRLKEENEDLDFQITSIPKKEEHKSVIGGDNLAVVESGNQEGAWEALSYFSEPENMEEFTKETGYFPPRQSVLNDSDYWQEDEHLSSFIQTTEEAEARGPSPNWPDISESIQLAIQESLTDEKEPDEALEDAQKKVESANE